MNQMTVRMNEWFFIQGLVGYKKILEHYGETVQTTSDGIIVEEKHLKALPEAFFSFYLKHYSVANREERSISFYHQKFKKEGGTAKTTINQRLNETKKKVERYFKETAEGSRLIEMADLYRKEKKYKPEMDVWVEKFIQLLYTEEIDQKLTTNFFKAVHLGPYFGQVSFLNVTHNSKSLDEQKGIFKKDIIDPVLEEWKFYSAIRSKNRETVLQVLDETSHVLLKPLKRLFQKKTAEEMEDYIHQELHKCSLTDFPIAMLSFEEGTFSPLSLSIKNAINMTWDANGKKLLPICSLARLIIFCSQAGATLSQGKSVFVYYGGSFREIFQTNQFYSDLKNPNKTFDEIMFDLVREKKLKAEHIKNHYLIYEYESDYQSKRTLLDYMVMTPQLVKLFINHEKLFNSIHHANKSKLIRLLLKGVDSKGFIINVLREKIKNSFSVLEVIQMIHVRHLAQLYTREEYIVDGSQQKRNVRDIVNSAKQIRSKIGEKKAQGIAYRLLNAIRSNNKNTFMDTVMRTYIRCDKEMPELLLEALYEDKMDFATVGNAWVAGLVSKTNDTKEGKSENE